MDSQPKRTLLATVLCLAILFGWFELTKIWYPPVKPADSSIATSGPSASAPAEAQVASTPPSPSPAAPAATTTMESSTWEIIGGKSRDAVTLGDDRQDRPREGFRDPYEMAVEITPVGASIESIRLSRYRNHVAKNKKNPDHDPYVLVSGVTDPASGRHFTSLVTTQLVLVDEKRTIDLSDAVWSLEKVADDKGESAVLRAEVREAGENNFKLQRTFRLDKESHHLQTNLLIENTSKRPRRVAVVERGPIGIKNDDPKAEYRRIVSAVVDPTGRIIDGPVAMRADTFEKEGASKELIPGENQRTAWVSLGNKYFTCLVYPMPAPGSKAEHSEILEKASARAYFQDPKAVDDLSFEQVFGAGVIAPGATVSIASEIFCGPKSSKLFAAMPQAAVRKYEIAQRADRVGWCTFQWLAAVMQWLLTFFYKLTRNYGVSIILLVIVVRTILHPVTKRGQVNMMKMQKSMAQLKPKIDALQQQYKSDRQKLNEETMKLYRTEGVNPAGSVLGCLPMFLQMPVWIALWTTLNTDADMRHEPFFWWIRDLSSPDALIPFKSEYHVPIIGGMMGAIHSFNLLPIIMTITMYAQQKFTQKLTKPSTPVPPKLDAEGNPIPDPMAQQQKMMSFMMIFFGLLFYNFPSGLNLYILSSNLLGMLEQYLIKKEIREKEARGDFEAKKKDGSAPGGNGRPSFWGRLAEKVEEAKKLQSAQKIDPSKKRRKQPRF